MAKKDNTVIYLVGLILIFFLFFTIKSYFPSEMVEESSNGGSNLPSIIRGTTEQGDVAIGLKPTEVSDNKIVLEISANTHSVELGVFDLFKIITLESNGKIFMPVSSPKLSGHHSNGVIIFEGNLDIDDFTIKIKEIPLSMDRVYNWNV